MLITHSGGAVAAPSANPFGCLSPTRAEHVASGLGDAVEFILDGGPCEYGVESTVLDLSGEEPRILRPGGTSAEAIEAALGELIFNHERHEQEQNIHEPHEKIISPGQIKSHYAPRTKLFLLSSEEMRNEKPNGGDIAYLFFAKPGNQENAKNIFALSNNASDSTSGNDLREAAANLFATLHKIDSLGFKRIYAERVPEYGLGLAINDRLSRASAADA
jgi:L-threonylcarbamoyladenylate synthase